MTIPPTGAPVLQLRPLSVGEILDASFTLYRKHFATLSVIVVVCSVLPLTFGAYLFASGGFWANLVLVPVFVLVIVVLSAIAAGATVFIVSESYLGRAVTAGEAFRRAAPMLGRIVVGSVLVGLVVLVGFLVLFVPGVILLCGLLFAIPALVLEPQLTAARALSRSWALTRGAKWRMFGLLVTSLILIYIPAAALEGVAALVFASTDDASLRWMTQVLSQVVQMLLSPFFYCAITVAYYDMRVRKEGFDLELLASSLQPA